ncbi:hypothetical protein IEJ02_20370 [Streptomyces sp. 5-10]|nr:hypothetical protein [Streptomyces sp. 5-10]
MAAAALITGGLTAATTAPASAAPTAAQSCYGNARVYSTTQYGTVHEWPAQGYAKTTSACNDINVKTGKAVSVRVCFERTATCNSWKWTNADGSWRAVATDVSDGTNFWLQFGTPSWGHVAM